MKQKDAVFSALMSVLGKIEGNVQEHITPEQRKQVNMILFDGFRAGKIALDREFTDTELKQYVSGLQSNWLRKDTRLNGGTKYVAKNPGSRAGSGNAELKSIRALKATVSTDHPHYADIIAEENRVLAEIAASKTPTVDYTALPEALRAKFTK